MRTCFQGVTRKEARLLRNWAPTDDFRKILQSKKTLDLDVWWCGWSVRVVVFLAAFDASLAQPPTHSRTQSHNFHFDFSVFTEFFFLLHIIIFFTWNWNKNQFQDVIFSDTSRSNKYLWIISTDFYIKQRERISFKREENSASYTRLCVTF